MFNFEGRSLRVTNIDNKPWFTARDVVVCLGLKNITMALAPLASDQKGVKTFDTPGGRQACPPLIR
ncbi:MAG: hypothetical protein RDU24_09480 [Humidesulfovibrio sp.]|uniref:BRO-N domain-containing protein n=1 Tax=Humidesulfovibrio sp. TaxID=2910988 RepID=UPI0027FADF31|nr:hypothetical protein [Humidesulfovibrio sp.]MDQ7835599.1 hypothetical protein [Humidesulfovibrio sp.]